METVLLLKSPSLPTLHSPNRHHLRSRSAPLCFRWNLLNLDTRRRALRCTPGDIPLFNSFLLTAAATAAALFAVYSRRDQSAEFHDADIFNITSAMEDGDLCYHHGDLGANTEILEDRTKDLLFADEDNIDFMRSKPIDNRDENVLENKDAPDFNLTSHESQSNLFSLLDPSLRDKPMEVAKTREGISPHLPHMAVVAETLELDIIKELLLANKDEGEEVYVFRDLRNQQSQNEVFSQVNDILVPAIPGNPLVHEEAVGEPQVGASAGMANHTVKNSFGSISEVKFSHHPVFFIQNQIQAPGELSLPDETLSDSHAPSSFRRFWVRKEVVLSSSFKEPFSDGGKVVANLKSPSTYSNRRLRPQRKYREEKIESSSLSGITVENLTDISLGLRYYNHLLREGRLTKCVDLLEKMEMKGFLDMDKVYHAKFLKMCKVHKAVKEAFRFTNLIKNSTLSTYNMLLSVCAHSQNYEGASQVLLLVKDAGLRPDCKLYTTLISTCGKSGKVDAMFEVFHEMVNAGVEPNLHTYSAIIDGCARAGQVGKAFGAYGIMISKNVKPDRVIFNALITACGQTRAIDRAFDVLAEMRGEPHFIDPDHVTVGALIKTCIQAGQADRAREVYQMLQHFKIKGTADVYTIAVHSCSMTGDLEFALSIYDDMRENDIIPDEMFLSTIIDVAGHAGRVDVAIEIVEDARLRGLQPGTISYSSLMGAFTKAKSWQKALELYVEIKSLKLPPSTSTVNALLTCLCDCDQLQKAVEILLEVREAGVRPNAITYSILIVACEKKKEVDLGFDLLSHCKTDGIVPNLVMCRCLIGLCLQRYEKAYALGEPILSFNSGGPHIDNKWTHWALLVYREAMSASFTPSSEVFTQVLGCLKFPNDIFLRKRFIENLGISVDNSRPSNLYALLDGFGEYDSRAFSICEEASLLGMIPCISYKDNPIIVDARKLLINMAEVYILTILKHLKHHLAAGGKLPNMTILVRVEKTKILCNGEEKMIHLSGRVGQAVTSLFRRLGLPYQADAPCGKIKINGLALRRWFMPKIAFQSFGTKPADLTPSQSRLAKEITNQQRVIRSSNNFTLP